MGRCYEFGVSITAGCEHAMVVGPEGGYCQCPSCGKQCPGQFKACAQVVAIPNYVPPGAPTGAQAATLTRRDALAVPQSRNLAVDAPAPTVAAPELAAAPTPAPQPVYVEPSGRASSQEVAELRALVEVLLDRPDGSLVAVEALRQELASRDADLVQTFERLTDAYQRLTNAVRADHAAREALAGTVDRLSQRIEALHPSTAEPAVAEVAGPRAADQPAPAWSQRPQG